MVADALPLFDVYLESFDKPIAYIHRDRQGLQIVYSGPKTEPCISIGLADQPSIQSSEAFLWNLLPEGRNLESSAEAAGVRADDLVGLLNALGRECAGSIGIVSCGGTRPKAPGRFPDDYRKITQDDVTLELDRLSKGQAPERKGLRMSLAGVQRKLGLHVGPDGAFYEPAPGAPTTAILKIADSSGGERYTGLVENENFCMHLADACDLNAAQTTQKKIGRHDVLLVTRFDRLEESGTIRRLHQEDVCQALGYAAGSKYATEIVSAENLRRLLDSCRKKAAARAHLFDAMVFNYLVGNADGHAKNFGLMHEQLTGPSTSFAPLYDVVCTALYPSLQTEMALPIGGEKDPDKIEKKNFEQLATDLGALPIFAEKRVKRLVPRIYKEAKALMNRPEFTQFCAGRIVELLSERSKKLAEEFGIQFQHNEMMFVEKIPGWSMS